MEGGPGHWFGRQRLVEPRGPCPTPSADHATAAETLSLDDAQWRQLILGMGLITPVFLAAREC